MTRMPFGVSRLDSLIGGGAPEGSVVLLVGEAGAGAREFLYTTAVMNALGRGDPDLFDLHYGDLHGDAALPDGVHYISFTMSPGDIEREIGFTIDEEVLDGARSELSVADLSTEYFQLSPVPREWYAEDPRGLSDLGEATERRDVIEAFADYLDRHADDSLVLVDSLGDLAANRAELPWEDVVTVVKGLRRAVRQWGGVVLLHVGRDVIERTSLGDLVASVDGTIQFEWETGGNERVRTMYVREFRGVLSQLEDEDIIRFETELHEAGFDVSNVRKIR
ncbi:RAD55 family ATPase [Halocalculus aciditolerans]|uniref:HtlC n=1 Tax=Halocalculus aciditolerans TaxID=1383812 RepID=A0A830FIQ1_9EURY|nr:HTR-like protein [Halocalculus aciditolerans]GGL51037.1 HtlC [Halocalculus aciditolerans]